MDFNQSLQDLLHEHECVILPQFGGFIANYKPAFVHPKTDMIHPPSKQISFNVKLQNNDGLLANYISQKHEVAYQVAADFVNSTISSYSEQLKTGNRLELEGIGILAVNKSGSIEFSPSNSVNFLRSSFGLSAVYLPTLHEISPQAEIADAPVSAVTRTETPVVALQEETHEKPARKVNRKWLAAAMLVPFLFFGGYTVHQNSANVASLLDSVLVSKTVAKSSVFIPRIEDEKIQFTYEEPVNQLKLIADQNPELQSVFYSFETAEISPNGLKVLLDDTSIGDSSTGDATDYSRSSSALELYFIVAGCFKERNNADGLVKKLRRKGFDAGIFGKKGSLHLVCYGSYTNKSAAKKALSDIKSTENPGAWLKKH